MNTPLTALIVSATMFFTAGCASILSKSDWPVTFNSNPSGAELVVKDKRGREVHRGRTPSTLTLPASSGFFQPARYDVEIGLDGYNTGRGSVTAGANGWYFGNILFGGLIGLLIVDPATGAMFKLPEQHTVNLIPVQTSGNGERQLQIISFHDIPEHLRRHLVKLQ